MRRRNTYPVVVFDVTRIDLLKRKDICIQSMSHLHTWIHISSNNNFIALHYTFIVL